MSNDWIEHNGGPQPVAGGVCIEVDEGHVEYLVGPARDFDWNREEWFRWRILNQHLIDAARLEGIRLGLEAAAKEIAEREETASNCPDGGSEWLRTDHMKADILALNPQTIARDRLTKPAQSDLPPSSSDTAAREAVLDQLTREAQADNMGYDNEPR